ncbi:MAG: hypothetical protein AAGF96_21745 [Bacteroidota bacterium]
MKHLVPFLLFFFYISVNSQEWKLIYQNDDDGNAVFGALIDLKMAVRNGKDIRIAWGFQHPEKEEVRVEHLADAAFLTIQSDSVVYAQIRPITGQTPDFENYQIILKENLEWTFIGSTKGDMDTMMRNKITGEIIRHQLRKSSFKWFVRN